MVTTSILVKPSKKEFQNLKTLAFLDLHKNELHHLDPIFMPFPKWGVTFLYLKNWRSY